MGAAGCTLEATGRKRRAKETKPSRRHEAGWVTAVFAGLAVASLVVASPLPAVAQAPRDEADELQPFAKSALHVGGALEFDWSRTRFGEGEARSAATFTLDADVGYFLADGLKVSGLPFFTVSSQGDDYAVLVGAAAGVAYYLDLGPLAAFARGRGGLVFGTTEVSSRSTGGNSTSGPVTAGQTSLASETSTTQGDVNGFLYGGGVGVALPVGTAVIELAVEYLGAQLTVKSDLATVDGAENGVFVRLGLLMVL